ncbi:oligosaccharide flippase family protein [Ramlibacter tataouinensis]|uniref:Candidate succinoglycan transport protein n=1 Tax=Ramlibacter tataouinensis (strain ATCC BAA-407 / DSM 14655 / LMG 21543 / TTB310) TaxID=365046 RepID=F5Y0F3_RAMTT|nr:oligosaccharide flippase family protein [Ramlibacter tataouinensis]AEG92175.1 Candidate succinoglycan transport protein [Ramlibacter tataouinensis TTB310]
MTATPLSNLAERALKWSALTTLVRFGLQLVAQVALARMLGPGNYGVYGIGIAMLTFATFLAGNGFSYSLMLQPRVDDNDIRFAFTWQTLAGAVTALAMLLAAPALAVFFDDPRVETMMQWLSLACLLTAMSATAQCLLQRELNFRAIGLVQLLAYAAGYLAVGVPLALAGWGADALAVACVVQAAVTLAGGLWVRRHPMRPLLRHAGGADALGTGKTVFVTNIVNWLLGNIDRVIIGRVLNAQAVGLYTLAYNLSTIPNTLLVSAVQPAFLSSGAKMSGEPQRLAQAWLMVLACVLVLVTPVAVVLALLASDLVQMLYGPAWAESAWVLALMFLCLPAWACWGLSTPVLWNTGRRHYEALLQLPLLALALPAWWLLTPGGLRSAAAVSAVVIVARAVMIVAAGLRALDLRWVQLLPFAARGLLLSLLCAGAVWAGQWAVAPHTLPAASLSAGSAAALAAGLLVLLGVPQLLGSHARGALARVLPFMRPVPPQPEGQP